MAASDDESLATTLADTVADTVAATAIDESASDVGGELEDGTVGRELEEDNVGRESVGLGGGGELEDDDPYGWLRRNREEEENEAERRARSRSPPLRVPPLPIQRVEPPELPPGFFDSIRLETMGVRGLIEQIGLSGLAGEVHFACRRRGIAPGAIRINLAPFGADVFQHSCAHIDRLVNSRR